MRDLGNEEVDEVVGQTRAILRIVFFWARWSDPSLRELSDLNRLQKEFRSRGVRILSFCHGEDFLQIHHLAREMGVLFPVYYNVAVGGDRGDFGRIASFPTTVLVSEDGTQKRLEGRRGYEALKKFIQEHLGGS